MPQLLQRRNTGKEDEDNNSLKRMTRQNILKLCKKNSLYQTPELNDVLYLHYQGYEKIECLEEYIGLKCIWLECNAITEIQGLENQKELRCLFLNNNLINKIENLQHCPRLDTINLSNNFINHIENIGSDILPELNSLNLSHNHLKTAKSLKKLIVCENLSVLDLSNNRIEDISVVKIFGKMNELKVLILQGNPVVSKIPQYRKTLILECKKLTYLDQRPVFPKDRACAEAWKRGGYEEERKEHEKWIEEERKKIYDGILATMNLRNQKQENSQTKDDNISENESFESETSVFGDGSEIKAKETLGSKLLLNLQVEEIMENIFIEFQNDGIILKSFINESNTSECHELKEFIENNSTINFQHQRTNKICQSSQQEKVHKTYKDPEDIMYNVFIKFHSQEEIIAENLEISFKNKIKENLNSQKNTKSYAYESPEDIMENIFIKFANEDASQNFNKLDIDNFPDYFRAKYEKSLKKAYQNYLDYINQVTRTELSENSQKFEPNKSNSSKNVLIKQNRKSCNDQEIKSPRHLRVENENSIETYFYEEDISQKEAISEDFNYNQLIAQEIVDEIINNILNI